VGAALYERFPALPEGDLSRVRAGLVNRDTLARVARRLGLGAQIRLGEGEMKSGGAERSSILADALEALFGAVFIDGGFDAARDAIVLCYADVLREADPAALPKDPKTRLQEWLQARRWPVPEYVVTETSGEQHEQQFTVECRIPGLAIVAAGEGSNRRAAEQAAADAASALAGAAERAGAKMANEGK
jgi:ribonuclease-3